MSFFIRVIKVLHFDLGLGWDHFLGGVPAQSSRREASTWTFLDRLDKNSNATKLKITPVLLFLCVYNTIDSFGQHNKIFAVAIPIWV